jgi:hypothetical protein
MSRRHDRFQKKKRGTSTRKRRRFGQPQPAAILAHNAPQVAPATTDPLHATGETPAASATTPTAPAQAQAGGSGGLPETALFERPDELKTDANLVKRSKRERWPVDKRMSAAILTKIARKALGLPCKDASGLEEPPVEFSVPQLLATGKLMLDLERQNQADDHHEDRVDIAEKSLAARGRGVAAKASVHLEGMGAGTERGGATATVAIYIPDNQRDGGIIDVASESQLLEAQ